MRRNQINFSQFKWLFFSEINDKLRIALETADIAHLTLFLDQLLDYLKAVRLMRTAKPLQRPMKHNSEHEEFWHHVIQVLHSISFYCPMKKRDLL